MIFQDPYSSLNPRKTVGTIIGEPFVIHEVETDEGKRKKRVQELMDIVGPQPRALQPLPARVLRRPAPAHRRRPRDRAEAEADRRRRAGLRARRLDPGADPQPAARPAARARADDRLHRPRPVASCATCATASRSCTSARSSSWPTSDELYAHPRHPYTGALLVAVPVADPRLARGKQRQVLGGDVPSPTNPPPACRFHTRCPKAQEASATSRSRCSSPRTGGNLAACHFPLTDEEIAAPRPDRGGVSAVARVAAALARRGRRRRVREFPEGARTRAGRRGGGRLRGRRRSSSRWSSARGDDAAARARQRRRTGSTRRASAPSGRDAAFVRESHRLRHRRRAALGHPAPMDTVVDEDLLRYDVVWAAAGTPRAVFPIAPGALVAVSGGRVARVRPE